MVCGFLSTLSIIFLLVMFVYSNLKTVFFVWYLFSYFFYFLFLQLLFTFKPLNALYSKFERLKISGSTRMQLKLGCQVGKIPLIRVLKIFELLDQGCPTFLLVRATFTGEKLLRATCIFTKIKLQIIASLLYKIGAHFGQYFGYLSPKVGENQKKGLRRKSVLILVSITGICPNK